MPSTRIIAAPEKHERGRVAAVDDLPPRVRDELAHFFAAATVLEGKDVTILGWDDAAAALKLIHEAAQ